MPVELFSHAFRPISLGIRLFANMFADHEVVSIFTSMTKLFVPVLFYLLGAFVCVVQAFVFTMLSAIYISLSVAAITDIGRYGSWPSRWERMTEVWRKGIVRPAGGEA